MQLELIKSRDTTVSILTGYRMNGQGVRLRILMGQEFSLLPVVQTGFVAHPASYPMGIGGLFFWGKTAGA
jgi:hypothetical protein